MTRRRSDDYPRRGQRGAPMQPDAVLMIQAEEALERSPRRDDLLGRWGLRYEEVKDARLGFHNGALTIPFFDGNGNLLGVKLRHVRAAHDRRFSWLDQGRAPALYCPPGGLNGETVVLTEGPFMALALQVFGKRPVAALANGAGVGIPEEGREMLRGKDLLYIADPDEEGRACIDLLARQLYGIATSLHATPFPPSGWTYRGEEAGDLNDLLRILRTHHGNGISQSFPGIIAKILAEAERAGERLYSLNPLNSYPEKESWPVLDPAARYGLLGDILTLVGPYSEADPVAILATLLVAFGNVVGRGPFGMGGHARHYVNEYFCLAGPTAKGRKGESWQVTKCLLETSDPGWITGHVVSGLSSGEGLIYRVRDPVRTSGKKAGAEPADPGVLDKRLLVKEEEFASPLRHMRREGNILRIILQEAWDSGDLQTLTRKDPLKATGAHISILTHTTTDDLTRHLQESEQANGFANRFLFLLVKRANILPDAPDLPAEKLRKLTQRMQQAVRFVRARVGLEMRRDEGARDLWRAVYPELSEGKPGLLGAILARAEAHVLRLSCLYALLDKSSIIRKEHLHAALAVWRYAETSARKIFGDRLGNSTADRILTALRQRGAMSETAIHDLFLRHRSARELDEALDLLKRRGLATYTEERTRGRPRIVWSAN